MAHLGMSAAALRIGGDDLDPTEITRLLGCPPTRAQTKGERIVGAETGHVRVAKTGMWRLVAPDSEPEDLDGQVAFLLNTLTDDLSVWKALRDRFEIDLFCGLFMTGSNEGATISAMTLRRLGERGIEIGLDIYGPIKSES